jgi:hypothetical protein
MLDNETKVEINNTLNDWFLLIDYSLPVGVDLHTMRFVICPTAMAPLRCDVFLKIKNGRGISEVHGEASTILEALEQACAMMPHPIGKHELKNDDIAEGLPHAT